MMMSNLKRNFKQEIENNLYSPLELKLNQRDDDKRHESQGEGIGSK